MGTEMLWKLSADMVVAAHFAWILAVVTGPVVCFFFPKTRVFHIAMIFITIVIMSSGYLCPLTYLENWLRGHHNPALTYAGGFIINYLERLVYVNIRPGVIFSLTVFWGGLWGYIYVLLRRREKRKRCQKDG